ncbi:MAG: cytochrome b/b6 domain-containing protein [Anaerolineales bacterium]|nr:cytochrome b/b6 domain-containing protein [Anaerolineales bacterium]
MSDTQTQNNQVNASEPEKSEQRYLRFKLPYRIEHWIFITSFSILAVTGLVQKFANASISELIVGTLGGIENTRLIHHYAATITMFVAIYHIGALIYRTYVLRYRLSMLPWIEDVRAAIGWLGYNFGLKKTHPQEGRYTFGEKFEYWAVVWGTMVMAITGYMMWNPISTTRFLPGEFIPAAKTAHGWEAILAVLAIIVWHFYNVLIRFFNKSMFIGYIGEEEMVEDHPLELADMKAGLANVPIDPKEKARRKRIFWPVYLVVASIMLTGVYFFISYEETAIATVPPAEDVAVFVPLTPTPLPTPLPTPTPLPAGALITWEDGIADLFEQKCVSCHNSSSAQGGLDLSSYESALTGGDSGPGIVPGDPDASQIVIVQAGGVHPGQVTDDELETITSWITNGAPEN